MTATRIMKTCVSGKHRVGYHKCTLDLQFESWQIGARLHRLRSRRGLRTRGFTQAILLGAISPWGPNVGLAWQHATRNMQPATCHLPSQMPVLNRNNNNNRINMFFKKTPRPTWSRRINPESSSSKTAFANRPARKSYIVNRKSSACAP